MSDVSVGHEMVLSSSGGGDFPQEEEIPPQEEEIPPQEEEIPPQEMCSVYITCILYRGPGPVLGRNKAARSS